MALLFGAIIAHLIFAFNGECVLNTIVELFVVAFVTFAGAFYCGFRLMDDFFLEKMTLPLSLWMFDG